MAAISKLRILLVAFVLKQDSIGVNRCLRGGCGLGRGPGLALGRYLWGRLPAVIRVWIGRLPLAFPRVGCILALTEAVRRGAGCARHWQLNNTQ